MARLTMRTPKGAEFNLSSPRTEQEERKMLMAAYKAAINKLSDYEDAEEQGLLVMLPCKIGDTVYILDYNDSVIEAKVRHIGVTLEDYNLGYLREFKNIYLTREEAEKALKEQSGGGKDE